MTSEEIKGIYGAVQLPINSDESIDYEAMLESIDRMIEFGVHGIYTNGTSGEFWTQTEEEFEKISEITVEKAEKANLPFQLGASSSSPQVTLERIKRVKHLRPGAFQVIISDWFPLNNAKAVMCLEKFAEIADPIKLVLYNPPHAKRQLSAENYAYLKDKVPAIIGTKSLVWRDLLQLKVDDLSVFCGGIVMAEGYKAGARGSYSEMACLHPSKAVKWFELMENDIERALKIGQKLQAWRTKYIVPLKETDGYSSPAVDKLYAAIGTWCQTGTRLRWPYNGFPDEIVEKLSQTIREEVPEYFEL